MKKGVIVGGGPLGLYLAYMLHKQGLKDIIVCDPRIDEYTRPGHLNHPIFVALAICLNLPAPDPTVRGHIKTFERILLGAIQQLPGITLLKKQFKRLSPSPAKGIIVCDEKGNEKLIACDFVIDSTGSARAVIHDVNKSQTPAPFVLSPISSKVTVTNHLLAYVKIIGADQSFKQLKRDEQLDLNGKKALQYVKQIETFRRLGWREFGLPVNLAVSFAKDKMCFYSECPSNLPKSAYEYWLGAIIALRSKNNPNISFEVLPPSKKYKQKPRLITFTVNPLQLNKSAHQAFGFPMVIANGDTQIDPHYELARGIYDGMLRADEMIKHLMVQKGNITFDNDAYFNAISPLLEQHSERVVSLYDKRSHYYLTWLTNAKQYYAEALQGLSVFNNPFYFKTFNEIQARLLMNKAIASISRLIELYVNLSFPLMNAFGFEMFLHQVVTIYESELNLLTNDKAQHYVLPLKTQVLNYKLSNYQVKTLFAVQDKEVDLVLPTVGPTNLHKLHLPDYKTYIALPASLR